MDIPHETNAAALLDAFEAEALAVAKARLRQTWYDLDLRALSTSSAIIAAPLTTQICVVHLALVRSDGLSVYNDLWQVLRGLIGKLFARHLPFTPGDLQSMLEYAVSSHPTIEGRPVPGRYDPYQYGAFFAEEMDALIRYAEMHDGIPPAIHALLVPRIGDIEYHMRHMYRAIDRFKELAGVWREGELLGDEPWATAVMQDIDAMDASLRAHWLALFALGIRAEGSKPTKTWLRNSAAHRDAIGREAFVARLTEWFPLLSAPASAVLADRNGLALRGLVWLCASYDDVTLCRAVSGLAEAMYRKIPGAGPRARKVATACLAALSEMGGSEPVVQLSRLGMRLKGTQVQGDIEKALSQTAARLGLSRIEIAELTVPSFGLNGNGVLRQIVGDYTAEIAITGTTGVVVRWFAAGDSPLKAAPAAVKRDHAAALKTLKTTTDEIRALLPAQRDRLERLLIEDRDWSLADWRARYADHPLLAPMVRRLIWQLEPPGEGALLVTFAAGQLVDVRGDAPGTLPEDTRVRLWHPITAAADTVLAWRVWLEEHDITQPFKQAHREIYLLTDAEIATETYSNRFAAHILRQPQFHALCEQRGWTYQRQGWFDQVYDKMAWRALSPDTRVQFFAEPIGEEQTETGWYQYITTDQVRFVDADGVPRPLVDIPARLFSEMLRDVDLFVGVTSIGSDPTWQNDGNRPYGDYWQGFSFGTLTVAAEGRRDVLARLLPRLKIAAQCTLTTRYLVVRGACRTYKIHLGSGNVLMEPNDQYLCIVPARGGAEAPIGTRFLPFEGDQTLSLILSKAFLLADDTHITDPRLRGKSPPVKIANAGVTNR